MNKLDKQYTDLLQDILDNGVTKQDRTGTGTLSVFGRQIRHKMSEGFPLLTTKKMPFKTITTELLWFLRGDTNIKYLVDNDCHIWNGDAYKNFVTTVEKNRPEGYIREVLTQEEFIAEFKHNDEFANKWGELGPIYGKQWRQWKQFIPYDVTEENCKVAVQVTDQIANLIRDLKTNPDSRRLMVSAWNVGELDNMTLPPCHYGFQVYTRPTTREEKIVNPGKYRAISLIWSQRSVDSFLGLPFNIASYGLLLEIIAKEVNMVPDELIGNLGDTHLYLNHIEQAKEQIGIEFTEEEIQEHLQQSGMDALKYEPRMEYISKLPKRTREPFPLPKLNFSWYIDAWTTEEAKKLREDSFDAYIRQMKPSDFTIENYQSHPTIKAPLSN